VAAWEGASLFMKSALILPGPLPVLLRFTRLLSNRVFLASLSRSFLRVLMGLVISLPLAVAAGLASGLDRRIAAFIQPFFSVISATPVMALILIVYLWFGVERTPMFTAFLMIFPVMSANTLLGMRSVDKKLLELTRAFGFTWKETIREFYLPSMIPFILGGIKSSLALSWKVVVASEVLVQPFRSLGAGMQRAKAQLETTELFAWTAGTVAAAALSEFIFTLILKRHKKLRGIL
jgi:NitT/TauT family transport system permease protein